jgi:cyanophycinase
MRHCFSLVALALVAANARTADPSRSPPIEEVSGSIVVAGSGETPKDVREAFFDLAGKDKAKIVVISGRADDWKPWQELKPATVSLLHPRDRQQADDPAFVKPIAEATAVWFADGKAERMLTTYRDTRVEQELKKLQARGGAIGGGGEAAAVFSTLALVRNGEEFRGEKGLGLLPGFVLGPKVEKALARAIAADKTLVGLSLDEGSAMVIRGRSMRVIGMKSITIRIAAGAGKPVAIQEAKAGSLFDIIQLRRAAANRASDHPFPPAEPNVPIVKHGSLVIVGGGGAGPEIWKKFIELAGGPDAPIVMIPTALEDPIPPDARIAEVAALKRFGATNVVTLHTRSRKQADDPKFSEALLKAKGVWWGGGRQWKFIDSYEGTLVEKRIREVLGRGGAIGGSSAGASIQSEYMPRGHPLGNTVMAAEGYERGFGYLPGCAVDQHFFARKRTADMTGLMKKYPQFLGIGIDEGTAIVVKGSVAEVIGRSKVAFYDTKKTPDGDTDYEEVTAGEKYDLKKRQRIK